MRRLKKWNSLAIIAAMLVTLLVPAALAGAADLPAAPYDVQLVGDQQTSAAGGQVTYHLLYHQVDNKNTTKTWLKIMMPKGMDPVVEGDAVWDESTRVIKWQLKSTDANGAEVIHFNVKIGAGNAKGTKLECKAVMELGGLDVTATLPVVITVGDEIDQPVFNGYPDLKFHPAGSLTRAEAAAVVARTMNLTDEAASLPYKDVNAAHWAFHYINKATKAGYMQGDGAYFRPEEPISRAEFTVLLLRMRGIKELPFMSFTDLKGHWSEKYVATAKALKYVDGMDDAGKMIFRPDLAIDRASAAKLLCIALFRGPLTDGDTKVVQHWPDVEKSYWAFGWVEELSLVAHQSEYKVNGVERLIRYLPDQTEPF